MKVKVWLELSVIFVEELVINGPGLDVSGDELSANMVELVVIGLELFITWGELVTNRPVLDVSGDELFIFMAELVVIGEELAMIRLVLDIIGEVLSVIKEELVKIELMLVL